MSTQARRSPSCRQLIGDGLVIADIALSTILAHRTWGRAIAYVAFGGAAILVVILLLKPAHPPYLPQRAEPRAQALDSGRWAVPDRIVTCESSEQNLPPNEAGAAGYYQITSETWAEGGGSPPDDASQHSKAEQDVVAARLWAGGAGAGRWVCK